MTETHPPNIAETITLEGGAVVLRAIKPEDAPRLQALHDRLSAHSIYMRFHEQRTELPDEDALRLATVDYQTQMALVAADGEDPERIVAVARYAIDAKDELRAADVAVVVEDAYQGRGLGTKMVRRLAEYAMKQGVRAFRATVRHDNYPILNFIRRTGLPTEKTLDSGVWDIIVRLPETSE